MKNIPTRLVILLFLVAILGAGGYYVFKRSGEEGGLRTWIAQVRSQRPTPPAAPAQAGPPPEVAVLTVQPAEVPLPVEYAGRVAGFRDVEILPIDVFFFHIYRLLP